MACFDVSYDVSFYKFETFGASSFCRGATLKHLPPRICSPSPMAKNCVILLAQTVTWPSSFCLHHRARKESRKKRQNEREKQREKKKERKGREGEEKERRERRGRKEREKRKREEREKKEIKMRESREKRDRERERG